MCANEYAQGMSSRVLTTYILSGGTETSQLDTGHMEVATGPALPADPAWTISFILRGFWCSRSWHVVSEWGQVCALTLKREW